MVVHKLNVYNNGKHLKNLHANTLVTVRMASTNDTFGFEILHKLYDNEIQKKEDIIILFVHWYLVKYGLRCIGIGDNDVFDASQKGSELLPNNWNTETKYALRYVKNGTLYLLCGVKSDDEILANLMRLDNDTVSTIAFPIERTVSTLHGSLATMIPSYERILYQLRSDFLKPICKIILTDLENTEESGTQTTVVLRNPAMNLFEQDPWFRYHAMRQGLFPISLLRPVRPIWQRRQARVISSNLNPPGPLYLDLARPRNSNPPN